MHNQNQLADIEECKMMPTTSEIMADCICKIRRGFLSGQVPKLAEDGTSGTYFLKDEKN